MHLLDASTNLAKFMANPAILPGLIQCAVTE